MPDKILPTRTDAIAVRPESIPTPEGKSERRELRTANSKTFLHPEKAADGKEIRTCHATLGAVCYRDDDGQLRSIDTTIRDLDGEIGIDWAPYRFRLHSTGIGFDFFSRDGGWVGITLSGIGGEKFDQDTPLKPDIVDNTITFRDVRPGCDIVFKCLNQRVKTLRILHDENAPRTFDWSMASDKPELIDSALFGKDAAGNQLELVASVDGSVITETWSGETQNKAEVVYPVEIDPSVTVNPADSGDDGYDNSGSYLSTGNVFIGNTPGVALCAGFRFPSVAIDQGVTVSAGTFGFEVNAISGAGGSGTLYGRAADNPGQFSSGDQPTNAARTSASTAHAAIGTTGLKTLDATSICQEILNRVGWASGNAIALIHIGVSAGVSNWCRVTDFTAGGNIEYLSITYTAAAGGTAGNLLLLGCG